MVAFNRTKDNPRSHKTPRSLAMSVSFDTEDEGEAITAHPNI
jgi:hypothetical protein